MAVSTDQESLYATERTEVFRARLPDGTWTSARWPWRTVWLTAHCRPEPLVEVAVRLAAIVAEMHRHGVIHKNINPGERVVRRRR